ncbi:MAG: DNA-methyltransferase [Gemmatimonadota bacterium]
MGITKKQAVEDSVAAKFNERARLLRNSPPLLTTTHRIYLGDAREMTELESPSSVQLVVTSPPYWTLKTYDGSAGERQLGHVEDYRAFLNELKRVWRRCYDVLTPGGRLCVVVGDVCLPRRKLGRHYVVPLHADISVDCIDIGFDYLTPVLWYKIANAVTEVEGNGSAFLGKPYEPNAIIKNDVEYVLIFRKPGGYRQPTREQRVLSLIDKEDHARWFRAVWADIAGSSRLRGHPAPYPTELAYRLIRMFSFVGDVVLDPFLGTGTTTQAAIQANRSSVGYEIEPAYLNIVAERFSQVEDGVTIELPRLSTRRMRG